MAADQLHGLLALLAAAEQALEESAGRGEESYVDDDTLELIERLRDRLTAVVRVRIAAEDLFSSLADPAAAPDDEPDDPLPPIAPGSSL